MSYEKLCEAISEAERFLKKAKAAKKVYIRKLYFDTTRWIASSNKETAAAKRASMDLTRALSEMRKP